MFALLPVGTKLLLAILFENSFTVSQFQTSPDTRIEAPVSVYAPCTCSFPTCTCCADLHVLQNDIRELGCARISYDSSQVGLRLQLQFAGLEIYDNEISAVNPPPACASAPQVPFIQFCAQAYEIHFNEDSVSACLKLKFQVFNVETATLDFKCVQLASGGLSAVSSQ